MGGVIEEARVPVNVENVEDSVVPAPGNAVSRHLQLSAISGLSSTAESCLTPKVTIDQIFIIFPPGIYTNILEGLRKN